MLRKGVVNVLLANIRTLVIRVTIFAFRLVPSGGPPKDGSEVDGLVDQPTVGFIMLDTVFVKYSDVEILCWKLWRVQGWERRTRTAC